MFYHTLFIMVTVAPEMKKKGGSERKKKGKKKKERMAQKEAPTSV